MRSPLLLALLLAAGACGDDDGGTSADADPNAPDADPSAPDGGPPGPDASQADANPLCGDPVQGTPTLDTEQLPGSFVAPVVALVPPGETRLFVADKPGRILIHDGAGVLATPFLDINPLTNGDNPQSERGFLGMAFHPQYAQNGRVYVYYTALNGSLTLAEYTRAAGTADTADAGSAAVLLTIAHPAGNHNGGWLAFGPDGMLYIGTGDGGGGGDPDDNGQNLTALLGKILRLDVGTAGQYDVPADNPFVGMGGGVRGEIWAYGVRNPWRDSFDSATGNLYIADVGQDFMEEINVQPAASIGGENYGWDVMEGTTCFNENNFTNPLAMCDMTAKVLPIYEYLHNGGGGSITGGHVYRGCRMPGYHGHYFFGEAVNGYTKSIKWNGTTGFTDEVQHANLDNRYPYGFGVDQTGELLLLDGGSGTILRLVPAP
jgi:glucose/arabinose dehydrogenase